MRNVYLLSAGLGTRLRPLTKIIPKCLAPVNGKPLLELWIESLKDHFNIVVNAHSKVDLVEKFLKNTNLKVNLIKEEKLKGTAGSIGSYLQDQDLEKLAVVHADNFSSINLKKMFDKFDESKMDILMATFFSKDPRSCGIVERDRDGKVMSFTEKPDDPKSNLANAAIYIFGKNVLEDLKLNNYIDLSQDFLAHRISDYRVYTYHIDGLHVDIGTMNALKSVQERNDEGIDSYCERIGLTKEKSEALKSYLDCKQ